MGWSATETGLVFGAAVLATALVTPIAGALTARVPIAILAGACGGLAALGLAGVALSPGTDALLAGMAVLGGGACLVLGASTPAKTTLGAQARPPALGASFALFNLAYALGLFIGPSLGGVVTGLAGFAPAMLVLAALGAIVAAVASWRLSHHPSLSDPAAGPGLRISDPGAPPDPERH